MTREEDQRQITAGEAVTLREYIEMRLQYMDRGLAEATRLMEDRMNGFPEQFVKKDSYTVNFSNLLVRIERLEKVANMAEGMATRRSVETVWWVALASLLTGAVGIVMRFLRI